MKTLAKYCGLVVGS